MNNHIRSRAASHGGRKGRGSLQSGGSHMGSLDGEERKDKVFT